MISHVLPSLALPPGGGAFPWPLWAAAPAAKSAGPTSCRPCLSGRAMTAAVYRPFTSQRPLRLIISPEKTHEDVCEPRRGWTSRLKSTELGSESMVVQPWKVVPRAG